jgi:prevent-host-death family protein
MRKQTVRMKDSKIGAFEAKTHLADLLRQVEQGRSFEICRRGRPIARLVPPAHDEESASPEAVREAFRKIRQRISGPVKIRALIEAGRRR